MTVTVIRDLTSEERRLAHWMLEQGGEEGRAFISQLVTASATSWRCPCGCASFNFKLKDLPEAPPGVHKLGDFIFGNSENLSGIFIFSSNGILSGVELYGLAGDAPKALPTPERLRAWEAGADLPVPGPHA